MQTPNSKKKIQFGQTNALSVPVKRTAEQSSIKIPEKYLSPDTYQIGIFWVKGSERKIYKTERTVKVDY